jgi:hypothetical protein
MSKSINKYKYKTFRVYARETIDLRWQYNLINSNTVFINSF